MFFIIADITRRGEPGLFGALTVLVALILSFKLNAGDNIGRPLFNAGGPLLVTAAAIFIVNWFGSEKGIHTDGKS